MPTVSAEQLAHEVHDAGVRFVIAVTGGGSGGVSALLGTSGASRSILAAVVPYVAGALVEWLGGQPDEFCSDATARAMAMAAFLKAAHFDPAARACGVSCTASLASDRPKRGPHRAHFAYQSATTTAALSLELEKGARSRAQEEVVVTALLLNHVADAAAVASRVEVPLLAGERIESRAITAPLSQQELLAARRHAVNVEPARQATPPHVLFPGAFHPLHQAHRKMAEMARQILGHDVAFEISIANVDKPPLDFIEIDRRARQFSPSESLWLTRAPTFLEKSELFPGVTFVVGADTIVRVGQERYYGDRRAMQAALETIAARGCRFLVFGRMVDGAFRALADLRLPETLAQMCREVPAEHFRDDISSTFFRSQGHVE